MTEEVQSNSDIQNPEQPIEEAPRTIHGGRNLMILGVTAIVISVITTAISLIVYRVTGDIEEYLNQLDSVRGRIDSLSNTFDPDPLNDDALGIYPHDDSIIED